MLLDAADLKPDNLRDPGADQIGNDDEAGVVDTIDKIPHLLGAADRYGMPWRVLAG